MRPLRVERDRPTVVSLPPQRNDDERANPKRPQVQVIVGRKDAGRAVGRTGHEKDLGLTGDPLDPRSTEELSDDTARHQRTSDGHASGPLA